MSQLTNLVPDLSLEDTILDPEELIMMSTPREGRDTDTHSLRSVASCDSCCMDMEPTEKGKLEVRVVPASFHRSNSIQSTAMPVYSMMRQPRGLAMIIDIETYDNDIQERRLGSHVDVSNLTQLLEGLQFTVSVQKDLSIRQFYKAITEFCNNKMHEECDMAVVAILSHGKDGVVYSADGQSINMEYIYEFFNNKNCPMLQGKPKFFIVQACRGDLPDTGVFQETEISYSVNPKKRRAAGTDTDALPSGPIVSDVSRARPTWEDMLIAYSTIPGYASIRDHENGTWFIQSLVEVFMNHAHDTELVDLLRMTSERLSQFTNEQGEKQTCNVEMRHLYKRIYFNPGLGRPILTRSLSTPPASPQYTHEEMWLWCKNMKRYPIQPFPLNKVNRELDLEPPPSKKAKKEKRLSWMKRILLKNGKRGSRKSIRKKTSKDNFLRAIKANNLDKKDAQDCVASSELATIPLLL